MPPGRDRDAGASPRKAREGKKGWRGELSEGPAQAKSGAARPGGHLEQLAVVPT